MPTTSASISALAAAIWSEAALARASTLAPCWNADQVAANGFAENLEASCDGPREESSTAPALVASAGLELPTSAILVLGRQLRAVVEGTWAAEVTTARNRTTPVSPG